MVVEDNPAIREGYKNLLIEKAYQKFRTDAHVDTYSSLDDAIRRLLDRNQPTFDLLFTDIDLSGAPSPDKAGISFAKFARTTHPGIPVVGCSGYFSDSDLSLEEKNYFDAWWPKGSPFVNLEKMFNDAIQRAIESKQKRLALIGNSFIETPETEEQFKTAGYLKKTLLPNSINRYLQPFSIWVRESEEGCEIEVVGCPALIAWGDDYAQALEVLDELIDGYCDLLNTPDHLLSPSMWQARAFIRKIQDSSTSTQDQA